jgi:hypothetical protein
MRKKELELLHNFRPAILDNTNKPLQVLIIFFVVTLFPSAIYYLFETSSQSSGIVLVFVILIIQAIIGISRRPTIRHVLRALFIIAFICIGILFHALLASYFQSLDFVRMLQSLILLASMLLGAYFLTFFIFESQDKYIDKAAGALFFVFVLVGVLGALGIELIELASANNPVFPFAEPSHYAIAFTPVLLFVCARSYIAFRLVALFSVLVIAFFLESLSLVVGVILVAVVTLPIVYLALAAAGLSVAVGILDVTYFASRLNFSYDSQNLSVLVYLQGWELMLSSVKRTLGWGLGFQQLGFGPIDSPTADAIMRLVRTDANLKDGGFTLAKATSEFGFLGFAGFSVLAVIMARSAWMLRGAALARTSITAPGMLAMSFISGYAVEAFLRGVGYFSGSTMMLIAAVIYMSASERAYIDAKS